MEAFRRMKEKQEAAAKEAMGVGAKQLVLPEGLSVEDQMRVALGF